MREPTAWPLAALCGIAGLILWGIPGAIVGSVAGFAIYWSAAGNVRDQHRSTLPEDTREDLSRAVLRDSRDVVGRAFPEAQEPDFLDAVGKEVDAIIWRAEAIAAPDRSATSPGWAFSPESVERAVAELQLERKAPSRRDLLAAIWSQMQVERDWYG